jgi:alpha-beta hydrolase superfamily lysophospholipase
MYHTLVSYRRQWRSHVLAYEYPGYGMSEGVASEAQLNVHAIAAYRFVREVLKWPAERVILYGHSIGSGPTMELSRYVREQRRERLGGIILQSPYSSIQDVVASHIGSVLAKLVTNRWNNRRRMREVSVDLPVLLLHGVKDTLIPLTHSQELYDVCRSQFKYLVKIADADHNRFAEHDLLPPQLAFFRTHIAPSTEPRVRPALTTPLAAIDHTLPTAKPAASVGGTSTAAGPVDTTDRAESGSTTNAAGGDGAGDGGTVTSSSSSLLRVPLSIVKVIRSACAWSSGQ